MPKQRFSDRELPSFDSSPPVVLVCGKVPFFVEENAEKVAARFAGEGAELLEFDDEASPEAVSDALLNRSLFSPRRVVRMDVTRLLGSESPGQLLDAALEGWRQGDSRGRRQAFRNARALLAAVSVSRGEDPAETAEAVCRRIRRKEIPGELVEILRELPEDRAAPAAILPVLRRLLEAGNDGVIALLTATSPPPEGAAAEIRDRGLVLEVSIGEDPRSELRRLALDRAREREVALAGDAITRLLDRTNADPDLFAAELSKLLAWAGTGGTIRASDVGETVADESAEDVYRFFDAIGRRDAGEALGRLERLFSGRGVVAGKREIDTDYYWPNVFLGMLATELRRMLYLRAVLDPPTAGRWEPGSSADGFMARYRSRLEAPVAPFGRPPFSFPPGKGASFLWYNVARRAKRFEPLELARALARAADVDASLKSSAPALETLSVFVGELIAGA